MSTWKPAPWIAAVLGLFVSPLGMLYVQRPWWAVAYLLVGWSVGLAAYLSIWAFDSTPINVGLIGLGWAISIGCAVHAFRIASTASTVDQRKWYSRWYALVSFLLGVFVIALVFRSFLYEPFRIPSQSMHPTIPEGSIVFVQKAGFGHYGSYGIRLWRGDVTETIARGDVVVHQLVTDAGTNYISRIVGIPGDHVRYVNRRLSVNGKPVPLRLGERDEIYQYAVERLDDRDVTIALMPQRPPRDFDQVVPPDRYVVFGDSRDNARDSRFLGLVPRENIVGRLVRILPPGGRLHE